jgi:signal transduction histidine kinase
MRRPWYTYLLLFLGGLGLLGAAFRPMVGVTSTAPGGRAGLDGRLTVSPGSPLDRAGVRTGDRFLSGDTVEEGRAPGEDSPTLRWTRGIPRSGHVEVTRGGERLWLEVRPRPPAGPVRLGWALIGLLNVGLAALALALFWQRPRDGAAVLLGLVLIAAPVFAFPREPQLLPLTLAAHFFTVFPPSGDFGRRRRFLRAAAIYLPFLLFSFVGVTLWGQGKIPLATAVFNTLAIGYAGYGLGRVLLRWREPHADRRVVGTLTVAAGAIMAAVLAGVSLGPWIIADQFVPANLLPALLFSGAVAHLVFRLRALEVRITARRTLQYLLARWTLGTLFLIPGFLLVWRFGQLSALGRAIQPREILPYLVWMFVAAVLLGKRQEVLRNLDRRFFRDVEAARQALIRLAHELGRQSAADAVLGVLERGVRQALHPVSLAYALADAPADPHVALTVPVQRGDHLLGYLHLGPKESGDAYTPEERELLEAAAVQAAVSLENARLSAALLARQREELAVRTAGVLAGAEEERRRLAADLHDGILPELRQMAAEAERLQGSANGLAPDLKRLEQDLRSTMDGVREVMEALRPSTLDMLGLGDALESYLRKGAARCQPPPAVTVRRTGAEPALTPEQSLGLYRICQEAINNLLKHSGARRAGLEVHAAPDVLTLALWDDGCGLDSGGPGGGYGLGNIRYRADLIGAEVAWQQPEDGGTRVEVRLPLAGVEASTGP